MGCAGFVEREGGRKRDESSQQGAVSAAEEEERGEKRRRREEEREEGRERGGRHGGAALRGARDAPASELKCALASLAASPDNVASRCKATIARLALRFAAFIAFVLDSLFLG